MNNKRPNPFAEKQMKLYGTGKLKRRTIKINCDITLIKTQITQIIKKFTRRLDHNTIMTDIKFEHGVVLSTVEFWATDVSFENIKNNIKEAYAVEVN